MSLLSDQFNLLKQVEFDWDDQLIEAGDVAVKLAIYKEQNKVAFKMADFYLSGAKFVNAQLIEDGIKKFIGKRRLLRTAPKKLYDRTADRGKD
jgi:hypothetical protein